MNPFPCKPQEVRALLSGASLIVRPLKVQPTVSASCGDRHSFLSDVKTPFAPGDEVWVRETFARVGDNEDDIHACPDLRIWAYYRADSPVPQQLKWRPAITMPRHLSRLTLRIQDVCVLRLQDLTEEDARDAFAGRWIAMYGVDAWVMNPWVWAATVERIGT